MSLRILLLGDYSNVHATLCDGLRELGHDVVVASDGDGWKDYRRDIDLRRKSLNPLYSLYYYHKVCRFIERCRDYDVVQLINPVFFPLRAERHERLYDRLRSQNGRVFLGAYGMDYYWVKAGMDCRTFRYSDFNMGESLRHYSENDIWERDWLHGAKGVLNRRIAQDCDGIIAGLYEYYASYQPYFKDKLTFIPFPIKVQTGIRIPKEIPQRVKFFIGIQQKRSEYKGTDIMLQALERCRETYPDAVEIVKVESVPFNEYRKLLFGSDVILDQLYSYTPAMNALEAMAHGIICVGGGEPESYDIIGEHDLHPVFNVLPNEESVYQCLCHIVENRGQVPELRQQALDYIAKHHDHVKVAQQYVDFWQGKPSKTK